MTWFDTLHQQMIADCQQPHVLACGSGRLLVCEQAARVLACELPGVGHNLFFHTDRTADDGGLGPVTGGDRLWIAPEVAYFWPTLDDALRDPKGTAKTPAAIDPGEYTGANGVWDGTGVSVEAMVEGISDVRSGATGVFAMTRDIFPVSAPRFDVASDDLAIASFAIVNGLERYSGELLIGAWDILQVPPMGTLICPTVGRAEVRSYYEPFGDRHVVVSDTDVRFLIDGKRRIKMGLRAEHTTGRMGYYRPADGQTSTLIVRIFAPLPGEPYGDVPRDDPRNRQLERGEIEGPILGGDCLQAYNDDGDAFGGGPEVTFGEMEYHDPCLVVGRGPTSRSGSCVTHVMAGPDDAVRAVGGALLGVEVGMIG
ncbi:MAG: hypothetical protein AAF800_08895 [Planctomycetota bacterium]